MKGREKKTADWITARNMVNARKSNEQREIMYERECCIRDEPRTGLLREPLLTSKRIPGLFPTTEICVCGIGGVGSSKLSSY